MDDVVGRAKKIIEAIDGRGWPYGPDAVISPVLGEYFARALIDAHERIKAQAECIERLRTFVRRYDIWHKAPWPNAGLLAPTVLEARNLLQPGDMGESK